MLSFLHSSWIDPTHTLVVSRPHSHTHVTQLAAGAQNNIALTAEGKVYTWGCNDEGALGRLDYSVSGTPGKIDTGWVPNLVKGFLPLQHGEAKE